MTNSAPLSATTESIRLKRQAMRLSRARTADAPRLHQRRMQIQVVRHHGGAQDADRDVQALVGEARAPARSRSRRRSGRARKISISEAAADRSATSDRMNASITRMPELGEPRISSVSSRREQHAEQQRDVEQQVQADGRAQDFGQVAGGDRDFAEDPERTVDRRGYVSRQACARSRPVHDSQPRAERLEQDGHQVGHHQDPEQLVAEARAALEVGGPVARVHVARR